MMKASRALVRTALALALLLSVAAIAFSLYQAGPASPSSWAVVAAALAVVTSVVSSWAGQRVLELEEERQRPYPCPFIDASSRYSLLQLRVKNLGGATAHDIYLRWDKPLLDSDGKPVSFTGSAGSPDIYVLLPGDSVALNIGLCHVFFEKYVDTNYAGAIECRDDFGRRLRRPFRVSAEQYRHTLLYDMEETKTLYQLQKLPEALGHLTQELQGLRQSIEQVQERTRIEEAQSE